MVSERPVWLNRAAVEAAPFPSLVIRYTGWEEESCITAALVRLRDTLSAVVSTGVRVHPLRLVHVTDDIGHAARLWQEELAEPITGVTELAPGEGRVAGKQFVWGDGQPTTTYAVLLLSTDTVLSIGGDPKGPGASTVAHELGHIDDIWWRWGVLGQPRRAPPLHNDWPALRAFFAEQLWAECAANVRAREFSTPAEVADALALWLALLAERRRAIGTALAAHLNVPDVEHLWGTAIQCFDVLIPQLGRCVGSALRGVDGEPTALAEKTAEVNDAWGILVGHTVTSLKGLARSAYSDDPPPDWSWAPLEPLVEQAFNLERLEPIQERRGLRIRVLPPGG